MSTKNHRVEVLNENGDGYDIYHLETNTDQVYDFTTGKWLSEIIGNLSGGSSSNIQVQAYKYEVTAKTNKQKVFQLSQSFNSGSDTLVDVCQNGLSLSGSLYKIEDGNLVLLNGVSIGTVISFTVLKNVVLKEQPKMLEDEELIDGNMERGYYGKFNNIITGNDLISKIGLTVGETLISGDITWLKYTYNNKKILIAESCLQIDVSWNDLEDKDLIEGKVIEIDGKNYICRVPTSAYINPATSDLTAEGEWGDLAIYFFSHYNLQWTGVNRCCWFKESDVSDLNYKLMSSSSVLSSRTSELGNNGEDATFRPVLELIND